MTSSTNSSSQSSFLSTEEQEQRVPQSSRASHATTIATAIQALSILLVVTLGNDDNQKYNKSNGENGSKINETRSSAKRNLLLAAAAANISGIGGGKGKGKKKDNDNDNDDVHNHNANNNNNGNDTSGNDEDYGTTKSFRLRVRKRVPPALIHILRRLTCIIAGSSFSSCIRISALSSSSSMMIVRASVAYLCRVVLVETYDVWGANDHCDGDSRMRNSMIDGCGDVSVEGGGGGVQDNDDPRVIALEYVLASIGNSESIYTCPFLRFILFLVFI